MNRVFARQISTTTVMEELTDNEILEVSGAGQKGDIVPLGTTVNWMTDGGCDVRQVDDRQYA